MRLHNRFTPTCVPVVILLAAVVSPAGPVEAAASVKWYVNFEQASVQARELNKPMILDFWADWCAPCLVMEKEVYPSTEFIQAAQPFIAVRIDFDRKPELSRKYNVPGLPTIVITDSYGSELFRYSGVLNAKAFAALLGSVPHDMTQFNRMSRVLARDKNNFDTLEAMGMSLRSAGLFRKSNDYYARALQQNQAKRDAAKREAILTAMGANYLEVKDGKQAAEIFAKCLNEFPKSPQRAEWTSSLAQANAMTQRQR